MKDFLEKGNLIAMFTLACFVQILIFANDYFLY